MNSSEPSALTRLYQQLFPLASGKLTATDLLCAEDALTTAKTYKVPLREIDVRGRATASLFYFFAGYFASRWAARQSMGMLYRAYYRREMKLQRGSSIPLLANVTGLVGGWKLVTWQIRRFWVEHLEAMLKDPSDPVGGELAALLKERNPTSKLLWGVPPRLEGSPTYRIVTPEANEALRERLEAEKSEAQSEEGSSSQESQEEKEANDAFDFFGSEGQLEGEGENSSRERGTHAGESRRARHRRRSHHRHGKGPSPPGNDASLEGYFDPRWGKADVELKD